jgi:hypothetical protein
MTEAATSSNKIDLQLTPDTRRGAGRYRATALVGERVLFADSINLSSSRSRTGFLNALKRRAEKEEIECDPAAWEGILLQQYGADQAPDPNDAQAAGHIDNYESVLENLGITVLGENEDQSIAMWSEQTRKRYVYKTPARLQGEEILQMIGADLAPKLWLREGVPPHELFSVGDVRKAVALAAADAARLGPHNIYGQGVWRHGERLLIVNGAEAHLYDGENFEQVLHPKLDRHIIDFNHNAVWADEIVNDTCRMNAKTGNDFLQLLEEYLAKWNWTHPQDPCVLAALILATIIQTVWTWRPLCSVIGPSDAGKSTLIQEFLLPILGDWTIRADRSTEAGLRQAIKHHAMPVVIDEFDKYRHRQQVLELFRTSSRGGKILRGTQNQGGMEFGLRHLPWFFAIESGDIWGQDRNRFIRCELQKPNERGTLRLPPHDALRNVGQQVVAAALWAATAAFRLANAIKSTQIDNIDGRLVESFSVPAAMYAVLSQGREVTKAQAVEILRMMLDGREALLGPTEPEEHRLFADIMASTVRVPDPGKGGVAPVVECAVGRILQEHLTRDPRLGGESHTTLEANGIRIVPRDTRPWLFIFPEMVQRKLLQHTRWEQTRVDQLLLRLPGAERGQQRIAGTKPWGILLPLEGCHACLDLQDTNKTT